MLSYSLKIKNMGRKSSVANCVNFGLNLKKIGQHVIPFAFAVVCLPSFAQQADAPLLDEEGYLLQVAPSEFNNYSKAYIRDWRLADDEHEDTEFGEFMYNEASTPTKLEILRLLSKGTPAIAVVIHAMAMGIDVEDVVQASLRYESDTSSGVAGSAANLLPYFSESSSYSYSGYELEDLERENEDEPYRVQDVVDNFFKERLVLRPYPDWYDGQYHFLASAAELLELRKPNQDDRWYQSKSTINNPNERPIFVSLYESSQTVLIDGEDRIRQAVLKDPEAVLPVVFIFNRLRERSLGQLNYPPTIRGVQDAYVEKSLMLTPVPEWQRGEYHAYAEMAEIDEIFNLPTAEDFEPEEWQKLLEEAEDYSVTDTSFLAVIVGGRGKDNDEDDKQTASIDTSLDAMYSLESSERGLLMATWDNPRTEERFKYVAPDGEDVSLENIFGRGIVINRPDLLAALKALGVKKVPVSFYYLDNSRVKPYLKGARALLNSAKGIIPKLNPPGGGGITPCASPPCVEQ